MVRAHLGPPVKSRLRKFGFAEPSFFTRISHVELVKIPTKIFFEINSAHFYLTYFFCDIIHFICYILVYNEIYLTK